MKSKVFVSIALACACALAGEREYLWPEGKMPLVQDHQTAAMTNEKEKGKMPYIEWQDAPEGGYKNDTCVILISGGSYNCQCDVGLVQNVWPKRLAQEGVRTVNFVHRTPRGKGVPFYMTAWIDGQRAVRLVRSQAAKRGFNPEKIVVMGMSAGAHLTAMLGTSSQTPAYEPVDALDTTVPCHVNMANTFALAYDPRDAIGAANFPDHMKDPGRMAEVEAMKFDAKTAPMCMTHGGKDPYSPLTSTYVYRKLRKLKVPAEVHIIPDHGHGAHCLERVVEFMRQMGFLGKLGRDQREDHRWHPNGTLRTEKEMLWPAGKIPDPQPNHNYEPYLVWYIPEKPTTKAIQVIVAGGGYGFCNYVGESEPVAYYLNQKGMTAVSVKYRCPRPKTGPKHMSAWQDAQRAIRMVRAEAPARGLDPNRIGIMGFSAGGHLTLMTSTNAKTPAYAPVDEIDKQPCTLQWACPIYPAYALTDGADAPNKTGGNDDSAVIVPEFSFDEDTPPMCFVHGDADGWACMNSVKCWEKLREMGKQSELHTLALRGHCFQMSAAPGTGSFTWLDRIWDFLSAKKLNK